MLAVWAGATAACQTAAARWDGGSVAVCVGSGGVESFTVEAGGEPVVHRLIPGSGTVLQDENRRACAAGVGTVERSPTGGLKLTRSYKCRPNFFHDVVNATAEVQDTFTPSPETRSVRWDTVVSSDSTERWSTAMATAIGFQNASGARWWFGGPISDALPSASHDPIAPFSLAAAPDAPFYYGGKQNDINHPQQIGYPATIIPVMTRLEATSGVTVAVSPEDTPIVAHSRISGAAEGAWTNFTRLYSRLGGGTAPAAFGVDVTGHEGCWRPAVAWMQQRYPAFFNANESVDTAALEGTASYADQRGPADLTPELAALYRRMAYNLNWDSTARFPWNGEWIPTAADGFNSTWLTCFTHAPPDGHAGEGCRDSSYRELASWYEHQRSYGFRTCAYGNLFEFGWYVQSVWPSFNKSCTGKLDNNTALLCHTRRLLEEKYGSALLYSPRGGALVCSGTDGTCIMDPDPSLPYLPHLVDMARTSMRMTPSAGVCVDRQDHIGLVNPEADDGVTWFPTVPHKQFAAVRAMITSWKAAMAAFAEPWHGGGKAVIMNDHSNRLDMMRYVDGIFAEMADIDGAGMAHAVGTALATTRLPAFAWNHPKAADPSLTARLETALQSLLFLGVYPMAPVRNNDHGIGGDCAGSCPYDSLYTDFGPLFGALKGKRWLLTAHAVRLSVAEAAVANAFETAAGWAVVVAHAGNRSAVGLSVALPAGAGVGAAAALRPGLPNAAVNVTMSGGRLHATVPLARGCSVLTLTRARSVRAQALTRS